MANFEGRDELNWFGSAPGDEAAGRAGAVRDQDALLEAIVGRIAAAERRQSEALADMQQRIAQLTANAHAERPRVPEMFKDAFERVEFAMEDLARRIAAAESQSGGRAASRDNVAVFAGAGAVKDVRGQDAFEAGNSQVEAEGDARPDVFTSPDLDRSAPPPLKSAVTQEDAERLAETAKRQRAATLDPFDFADEVTAGNPDEPWDVDSAEELTRAYENGAAGLPPMRIAAGADAPDYMNSISYHSLAAVEASRPELERAPAPVPEVAPAPVVVAPDFDRSWLEERFAEVASRVEQILSENRQGEPLEMLGERFVDLEQRFGAAVEDLAKRSDVAGLGDVEACIAEMAAQLEYTARELARVSEIEEQVKALAMRVSDERLAALAQPAQPAVDVHAIADVVASRIAAEAPRQVEAPQPAFDKSELDELKAMVRSLVSERRGETEHTSSMLDTMQQAMIRLLDRMDAIEDARAPAPSYVEPLKTEQRAAPPASAPPAAERSFSAHAAIAQPDHAPELHDDEPVERAERFGTRTATPEAQPQPSLSDYTPRRIDDFEYSSNEHRGDDDSTGAVALPADRKQFMEAARRAARQANERAREAAATDPKKARRSPPPAPAPEEFEADAGDEAPTAKRVSGNSSRVRVMVAAFAILALGLGATKLFMSSSDTLKRVFITPETQKREMLGQNGTPTTAPAHGPAPVAPAPIQAVPPAGKGDKGASNEGGVQPVGVTIAPGHPDVTAAEVVRQQQHRQFASWSTGVGAKLPTAEGVPPSMMPTVAKEQPEPQSTAPVTDAPSGQRVSALPSALVGPLSLRIAAANGDPSAEFEVGARFAEGKGVQQDFKQAVTWYRRAATRGFALAQYRLATLYERGLGVTKDMGRAKVWYQRAAGQGNVKAMHNLAVLAAGGSVGKPDYATAARWFEEAAGRGLGDSQFNLAILHQSGLGVERDLTKAYTWFGIAARNGDKTASERQAQIARQLKAVDIARADQAVAAWRRKVTSRLANDPRYGGEQWKQRANVKN